jgi:hypothetical protein
MSSTSASSDAEQQLFILSFNSHDLIRIAPTQEAIEKAIVTAVAAAWPRGLQASERKLGVSEYKLHGNPWDLKVGLPFQEPQMLCGPLVLALVRGLSSRGFRVEQSIDMSRSDIDTHAVLLRRAPPSEPKSLFGVWLVGQDSFVALEAPSDLVESGFEAIVRKHWKRGLQSKKTDSAGHTHFKLKGSFLLARGDEAIEARLFMANFHNELLTVHGFECVGSLDVARSQHNSDLMLFQQRAS